MSEQFVIEGTGIVAGVLTSISMLPQVVKIIRDKKAEDVSMVMLIILLSGIILWIIYGILRKDFPIIFSNGFSMLINIILIVLRIKFRK